MDKTELGLTIAAGILGLFLNGKQPNNTSQTQLDPGYTYVADGMSVMVSNASGQNIKQVTVKYDKNKSEIFYSHEHIDCLNSRHRVMKMDLYNGKQFIKSEIVDFPKWESNNNVDNLVKNAVCN